MGKKRIIPLDVSMNLMERSDAIRKKMNDIVMYARDSTQEQVIKEANKMVYELAQEQGLSLWNLCLQCAPDFNYDVKATSLGAELECNIRLIPMEFDFKHSPDYWEEKYYNLKKEMQQLLDKKPDQDESDI